MIERLRRLHRIRERFTQVAQAHYQEALANAQLARAAYAQWVSDFDTWHATPRRVCELDGNAPKTQALRRSCALAENQVGECAAELRRVSAEFERAERMLEGALETRKRSRARREQQAVDDYFGRSR